MIVGVLRDGGGYAGGRCSLPRLLCRPYHRSCAPHLPPPPSSSFSSSLGSLSPECRGSSGVKKTALGRRVVHVVLLSLTGGFALSALNDLAIFHGCSRKAIEKASQNQEFTDALGEPIVRGPWHAASLAVGRRRETVSCKFPVSGSKGNAILKIKAVSTEVVL
ncbi:unnamed protein product [Spirodela intermedia]|uniref:Uncharacterized protein n=1 Tax=Spirodela intermedia TaxID=51605 RepID=A0A7I8IC61_SPIIN|nr:unnamed protein product [Spirodela intermedia]CAA6655408.1 unnamed protein product [Spirodela intermedia]